MRSTLANVWHPIGGVSISDLENDRFLFRFYFEVDVDRVERNGPWNFNSHLLSRRTAAWRSQWLVKDGGRQGPSYGNSRNNNGRSNLGYLQDGFGKLNISILIGPIVKSGLGHCVNTVSDSFDDEMVICEEENSPMHNLDRLKRPRTFSFASGVSTNKDSTEASGILL
ncbi:hypothetical protein Gotri_000822 [Gossypium trilobum]|uniref:DUF4283 domain-containing protein n=1 Tax=Gossypium trilobum TaxID=34281 RepID=A0A7J9FCK1_9ROSI|nr:hypothetical protein [Gossypium trilobum]